MGDSMMAGQPLQSSPAAAEPNALPSTAERLELARNLFREFHGTCFWHCPHDLEITEEMVPFVASGLRTYGGHRGFALAAKLVPK